MKKGIILILIVALSGLGTYIYQNHNDEKKEYRQDQEVVSSIDENITYKELEPHFSKLSCGDLLFIENTNYLSSYAIPGRWKHCMFYIGTKDQCLQVFQTEDQYYQKIMKHYHTGDEVLIIDANSTGVKIREFKQMANLEKNSYLKSFTALRLTQSLDHKAQYLKKALDYYNTPYDYEMNTYDESTLYCSELFYFALKDIHFELKKTTTVFDQVVITPTNAYQELLSYNDCQKICLIYKNKDNIVIKFYQ